MASLDPKYVEVYRARNLPEAHSIRLALEESGIRVQIEGELLQGAVGELPPGWMTVPRLLVKKSQLLAAQKVIEQHSQMQKESRGDEPEEVTRCLACGKEMAEGNEKCPSCGWSYEGEPNPRVNEKANGPKTTTKVSRILSILRWCFFGTLVTIGLWLLLSGKIIVSAKDSYQRGLACFDAGENDRAIALFSQAIRSDPDSSEAWHHRGWAYERKGNLDRAIDDYSEAIRLNSKDARFFNSRAFAYFTKRDYDTAITDYNRAAHLEPNRSVIYMGRGGAYSKKKDYDRSIMDFSKAISIDPTDAYVYRSRGFDYGQQGETEKAIADFTEAIRLEPESIIALHYRALQYERKGDLDKAIDDLSKAIQLSPLFAPLYRARAIVYNRKGDLDQAKADEDKAIELESARDQQ